jgi:hypothetical protein
MGSKLGCGIDEKAGGRSGRAELELHRCGHRHQCGSHGWILIDFGSRWSSSAACGKRPAS